jgi:hypothetical protein
VPGMVSKRNMREKNKGVENPGMPLRPRDMFPSQHPQLKPHRGYTVVALACDSPATPPAAATPPSVDSQTEVGHGREPVFPRERISYSSIRLDKTFPFFSQLLHPLLAESEAPLVLS